MVMPKKARIYERQKGLCLYCDTPVKYWEATLDHIKPVVKGGKSNESNLAISCAPCNSVKGSVYYEDELQAMIKKWNKSGTWSERGRQRQQKKVEFWARLHKKGLITLKVPIDWPNVLKPTVLPRHEMIKAIASLKEPTPTPSSSYNYKQTVTSRLCHAWGRRFAKLFL